MGYHKREILRGEFGEFSKIQEEFEELEDALEQGNPIMALCEMADMIGAIEAFALKWNIALIQLIEMKDATARAFADGTRKSKG